MKTSQIKCRYSLIIITMLLLAFTTGDYKSEYIVPLAAYSICTDDLDLDGNKDFVVGHKFNSQSNWGGLSILDNSGTGYFNLLDTLFINNGFPYVNIDYFDNNEYPDIFSIHVTGDPYSIYIGVIYNYAVSQFDNFQSFSIISDNPIHFLSSGNINNNYNDIIFASNQGQNWGVIYNDGTGIFTSPEYFNLDYHPLDIDCGDLNGDNREDVVVCGTDVEIYFSFESGFEQFLLGDHQFDIEVIDVDNDGDNDVVGLSWLMVESNITIYENTGNNLFIKHDLENFEPPSSRFITSDLNNDTLPDIVVLPASLNGLYIFYNSGNCTLDNPVFIPIEYYNEADRNAASADFDGNGFNDIVITRYLHAQLPANVTIMFNDGNGNFVEDPIAIIQNSKFTIQNLRCSPNPFHNETTFEFYIKEKAFVELVIYNLQGEQVINLINKQMKGGKHRIFWDGVSKDNIKCKPGTYLAYLVVNGIFHKSIKIIIN